MCIISFLKYSSTYRSTAILLIISILTGFSLPRVLHAGSNEICDTMMSIHDDHELSMSSMMTHEDCPKADLSQPGHSHHASQSELEDHLSIVDCNCSIEEKLVEADARVLQKTKTLVLTVNDFPIENDTVTHDSDFPAIKRLYAYPKPPIFLVNESFLI